MAKKWYNFFVVTDDRAEASEAPAPATTSAGRAPEPPPVRAIDVVGDPAVDPAFEAAPAGDVDMTVDLGEVYASAQIVPPAHGYTILKVAEMLQSEHIRALPADVKRKSVMVALDAAGVKVTDIVEDAVRRDRALDTYERVLQKHTEDLRADLDAENARIEQEIAERVAELRGRIEANQRKLDAETRDLEGWRARKQQEEALIADAIGYFVSENPITAPARPAGGSAKGDADVRQA